MAWSDGGTPRRSATPVAEDPGRATRHPGPLAGALDRDADHDAADQVRRRSLTAALVVLGGVAAAVVGVLGLVAPDLATPVGALSAATAALVSGPVLLHRARGAGPEASFRRWIGWSVTVWGLGEVVQGFIALYGAPSFPTPGDIVSLLAGPLAVVGALRIPRRGIVAPDPSTRWRLPVDAALMALTTALIVWQFAFLHAFERSAEHLLRDSSVTAAIVLVADVSVTALAFLVGIRDLDRDMLLVAAGTGFYTVGDQITIHTILHGGTWPWQGALMWCLAWPLIAVGLVRYEPGRPVLVDSDDDLEPDARVVATTTYVSLGLLALGVLLVILDARLKTDVVSLWLVVAGLVVLAGREWLNMRLRARLVRRLRSEATTDPLTGLGNRRLLVRRLAEAPPDGPCSLLTVDLDGFKEVNAFLGHPTGDALLVAVARRIADTVPPGSLLTRSGGDEFAVLVPADVVAAAAVGERLVTAVRRAAADVPGIDRVSVSASVGVAWVAGPDGQEGHREDGADGQDPLAALSAAGAALRTAKAAGRDRVQVFDVDARRARRRRLVVEERLRAAIAADRLDVLFHPIVQLSTGRVVGAEALARWTDDDLGVVDPGEFIPVAEESGLVVALGELVLHRVLAEAVRHDLHGQGLYVGVNVSPVQLRAPGFDRVVAEALRAHALPSDVLVLEVTEAVFIEEDSPAVRTLRRLADAGVTIAIDDFGTGYSALGYLRRLPVHRLKVDRSLTAALEEEPQARAIVAAVVELGRGVEVSVVVEGVGTRAVADLVAGLGAGYGQGSLFGDPLTATDLVAAAATSRWRAPAAAAAVAAAPADAVRVTPPAQGGDRDGADVGTPRPGQ